MDRQSFKNLLHTTQPKSIVLVVLVTLITTLLVASLLLRSSSTLHPHSRIPSASVVSTPLPPPHPIIKNACTNTLYPSLCFSTLLSSTPPPHPKNHNATITLLYILDITINQTIRRVATTRFIVAGLFTHQDLNSQEKNALNDCTDMLEQTLYELRRAISDLRRIPASTGSLHRLYGNIKTLLSAAMTNENTCIDGFSDLEESNFTGQKDLKEYLQGLLTPISHMISNCLAMIKYVENINRKVTIIKNRPRLHNNMPQDDFQDAWIMKNSDRKMRETAHEARPNVVVAKDGSGKHHTIQEAVRMAPNRSSHRFVIRIKAGKYRENVVIPREKVNIVFVGDGMNSTVITGSRNFVDGFSTFTSATLSMFTVAIYIFMFLFRLCLFRCKYFSFTNIRLHKS